MARIQYIPNRVIDSNGISDGAEIFVYQSGTDTKVALFSDDGFTTSISNPVPVPAGAEVPVFYTSYSGFLRVKVVEASGVISMDDDPYSAPAGLIDISALRADLASNTAPLGASMVGSTDGRTVQARLDMVDQSIVSAPLANSGPTQTSLWSPIVGKADYATAREFGEVRTFYSSHGFGSGDTADKVVSYRAMWAAEGTSDAWTINDLFHHTTDGLINTHLYELDYNIITKNKYGTTPGGLGLAGGTDKDGNPFGGVSAWGVFLTGISTEGGTITGGYGVGRAGTNDYFQRGFVAATGCIQSGFEDDSTSVVAFRDCGAHAYGLDTTAALYSTNYAVRIARGHRLNSLNTSGTPSDMLYIDPSNNLRLGDGAVSAVSVGAGLIPVADNILQLGGGSSRWASVWAANGTIQTSDETLKTDIQEMTAEQTGAFIDALEPRLARWKVGGRKPITEMRDQEVVTGYETLKDVEIRPERPAEVINGQEIPYRPAIIQDVRSAITEIKPVEVIIGYEDIPGKRLHGQVLAQSIKLASEAAGFEDFAGWVKDEDGVEHARPDENLAVLVAEVQFLRKRVAALEEGKNGG